MKWTPWIAALTLIGLVVVVAVTVINRLSDREVALIVGAVCGAGVGTPVGIALGMAFAGQRQREHEVRLPPAPPVIYVAPPAPALINQPAGLAHPGGPVNSSALPHRSYNVIGGDDPNEDEAG